MTLVLADAFRAQHATVVEVDGRRLHSMVSLDVAPGTTVEVFRVRVGDRRPQLLNLRVPTGHAEVNDRRASAVRFDLSRSPDRILARIESTDGSTRSPVHLWNSWLVDGRIVSWQGNAAMDVTTTEGGMLLRCSDGEGDADFDDLVALIRVTQPGLR